MWTAPQLPLCRYLCVAHVRKFPLVLMYVYLFIYFASSCMCQSVRSLSVQHVIDQPLLCPMWASLYCIIYSQRPAARTAVCSALGWVINDLELVTEALLLLAFFVYHTTQSIRHLQIVHGEKRLHGKGFDLLSLTLTTARFNMEGACMGLPPASNNKVRKTP